MIRYETLMLIRSEAIDDELSKLEKLFDTFVSDIKGQLSSFDKWGKCRLAYPVQKHDYGIYILCRYNIPEEGRVEFFKKLYDSFKIKFNEVVMRHINIKIATDAPLDYVRPDSIEGARTGNLDAFLKESKIEAFLGDSSEEDSFSSTEEEALKGSSQLVEAEKEVAGSSQTAAPQEETEVGTEQENIEDENS